MGQNSQRDFFGIIIPVKILDDSELSVSEKFIYAYVASYSKFCGDSNDRIAGRLGVSAKTVSRSLARLQKLGYVGIKCTNNHNASRKIFATCKKPQKKTIFKDKKEVKNSGERHSFPQSFAQLMRKAVEYGQNVPDYGQNVHTNNR